MADAGYLNTTLLGVLSTKKRTTRQQLWDKLDKICVSWGSSARACGGSDPASSAGERWQRPALACGA